MQVRVLPNHKNAGRTRSRETIYATTRQVLIRCGMELLTEQGFSATGIDAVLRRATVPKGSFYHYFDSKMQFVSEVMHAYDAYWVRKLDQCLLNENRNPLDRLTDFVAEAKAGMHKHRYARGCLVGNLCQEIAVLPPIHRQELEQILTGWQQRTSRCLRAAQEQGAIPADVNCDLLSEYFWIGWEGAVMRARLVRHPGPLDLFIAGFLAGFVNSNLDDAMVDQLRGATSQDRLETSEPKEPSIPPSNASSSIA